MRPSPFSTLLKLIPLQMGVSILATSLFPSLSQALAAREMGMAPSTVSDILRGKRGIGRKHIEAFATYFHVSPAVFLPEA